MCVDSVLTLSERFPVVQSTYELIGVKGRTLLRPGVQRTSSAHLQDRNTKAEREKEVKQLMPQTELMWKTTDYTEGCFSPSPWGK